MFRLPKTRWKLDGVYVSNWSLGSSEALAMNFKAVKLHISRKDSGYQACIWTFPKRKDVETASDLLKKRQLS